MIGPSTGTLRCFKRCEDCLCRSCVHYVQRGSYLVEDHWWLRLSKNAPLALGRSRGRQFAAWLGLIPKQCSTGGKPKLLGISKNGNEYLRRLLIHGGRSIQHRVARENHAFGSWLTDLEARANTNVVAVAMANKLARIAWVVLNHQQEHRRGAPAVEPGFGRPGLDKPVPAAGQGSSINSLRSALTGG